MPSVMKTELPVLKVTFPANLRQRNCRLAACAAAARAEFGSPPAATLVARWRRGQLPAAAVCTEGGDTRSAPAKTAVMPPAAEPLLALSAGGGGGSPMRRADGASAVTMGTRAGAGTCSSSTGLCPLSNAAGAWRSTADAGACGCRLYVEADLVRRDPRRGRSHAHHCARRPGHRCVASCACRSLR